MANEPAYHSGLSSDGRSPSSASRCCVHARCSSSSRAASANSRLMRGLAGEHRLRRVQRLGADLAGVIDAHEPGGVAALVAA